MSYFALLLTYSLHLFTCLFKTTFFYRIACVSVNLIFSYQTILPFVRSILTFHWKNAQLVYFLIIIFDNACSCAYILVSSYPDCNGWESKSMNVYSHMSTAEFVKIDHAIEWVCQCSNIQFFVLILIVEKIDFLIPVCVIIGY